MQTSQWKETGEGVSKEVMAEMKAKKGISQQMGKSVKHLARL
jgi:hypothetical protein